MSEKKPSSWQEKIVGEWHGKPSIFDVEGNHVGFNKVYRESAFEGTRVTYTMTTVLDAVGPLRARFDADSFEFGVDDRGTDRVYLGPDFIGAGHPYGALVDAHYYSPQWTSDLRTMVHVLPDGKTQVYSSLLYDGPTINGVFNGIYRVAFDYHENPETKKEIDDFILQEMADGKKTHVLPAKESGTWTGEMQVYNTAQELVGINSVEMRYTPITLLRAKMDVKISGVFEKEYSFERSRNGHRHTFEGPDVYGNGISYGRPLYTSQHFYGEALKIKGREFLIDNKFTMSAVWQFLAHDRMQYTTFGVLHWQQKDVVLKAKY